MDTLSSTVANRGVPPTPFISALITWAKNEKDDVFAPNYLHDIYSLTVGDLGPWHSLLHRRAAMCEVLRVLAGFESSWKWGEGKDTSNPKEIDVNTWSAGIFQISPNAMNLHSSLAEYADSFKVFYKPAAFRALIMQDHTFAFGFTARLLRVNTHHNGPVRDGFINPWLKREAVAAFEKQLGDLGLITKPV